MATKSRTSNKRSNDSQKKLLALVLIILFIGLGVFLVVSSFAAKGGKGKPGSITLVDSPYGIKALPTIVKYPSSVTLYATDKATGQVLASPLPEQLAIVGDCSNGGSYVGTFGTGLSEPSYYVQLTAPSLANGATCTAYLQVRRNFAWANTAVTTFTITP